MEVQTQTEKKSRIKPVAPITQLAMSLDVAGASIGVSGSFLRLEAQRKHLEVLRLGRRIVVTPEQLQAYLARRGK